MSDSVYKKLQAVRAEIVREGTKKSGSNTFSNYTYFELDDFLPNATLKFAQHGLCPVLNFPNREIAVLRIYDADAEEEKYIEFTAPMGTATLKACHDAQNLGAAETYARRYLYIAALELAEHDALENNRPDDGKRAPSIAEKKDVIASICASIQAVDPKYRTEVTSIIRKHNGVANYSKMKDTDVAIADKIIDDLTAFYDGITAKEETA